MRRMIRHIVCITVFVCMTALSWAQMRPGEPETETARLMELENQLVLHRWIGSPVVLLLAFLAGAIVALLVLSFARQLPRKGRISLAIFCSLTALVLLLVSVVMLWCPWDWRMGPNRAIVTDGMGANVYHDDDFVRLMDDKGARGYELVKRALLAGKKMEYPELYVSLEALAGPMWRPDRHDEILVVYHRLLASQQPIAVRAALTSAYYSKHIHSRQIVSDILSLCDHPDPYIQKFAKSYSLYRFGYWLKLKHDYSDAPYGSGDEPFPLERVRQWWEKNKGDADVMTKLRFGAGQSWVTAGSEENETQHQPAPWDCSSQSRERHTLAP
jgi:hypothetical protein